jgi:hypothetical protein
MDMDAQVRQTVIDTLPKYGVARTEPNWETALVADGHYLGRRFEFDAIRAYWFCGRNTIEFYSQDWVLIGELKLKQLARAA